MTKIEKLTKEQEELMFITRDEWINDFFNLKRIDEKRFEEGINWIYEDLLKKKKPKIIYCESWISCLLYISLLKNKASVRDSVRASVEDSVRASVWDSVEDSVRASVRASVWDSVWASVRASVRDSVGDSVGASVWASVWDSVEDSVRASVRASVWDSVWASVEDSVWDSVEDSVWDSSNETNTYSNYGFCAFYDYFEKIGVLSHKHFEKYKSLIKSGAFQVYEYENIVFAIQPPKTMFRNELGRLNSIESKAFEWSDGYGFYYINGIELKEDLFLKLKSKTYTLQDFLSESNEETKSAVISFIQQRDGDEGIYRFFSNHLKEVDNFVDKKEAIYLKGTTGGMNVGVYTLFKGQINNIDIAYVRCYCPSTDRMFFLGVEPVHNNVKDAIASLYQVPSILKNNIKSISRQGEKFSTVFDELTTEKLKNNMFREEELKQYSSISGDCYFSLMTYEY